MKSILLIFLATFALTACKEKSESVVVAGDSWAFLACTHKSLDRALEKVGIKDKGVNSTCQATSLVGMRASGWKSSIMHKATIAALLNPEVKVLYLSLGGNDIMNSWNKNMTPDEELAALNTVRQRVVDVIQEYRKLRPDIKILLAGYDFPRFIKDHPIPNYKEGYEDMGEPTPQEMNEGLIRFTKLMAELADNQNVFFIHFLGLMHYYHGNSDVGLPPYSTLAPEYISSPTHPLEFGGDVRFQSDRKAMEQIFGGSAAIVDAFHLNKEGYNKLGEQVVNHYLKDWLSK